MLKRYLVPDLSPQDRMTLKKMKPRYVFVAESPHVSEVTPESLDQRRPLCGAAGRKWWGMLSSVLEHHEDSEVSLERLQQFCLNHQLVIMNAVQYPLDPKIVKVFPEADPVKNLGFNKVSGEHSFKRLKQTPRVQALVELLGSRLFHPSVVTADIYCLGNDSEWFVTRALEKRGDLKRLKGKIPHPSAWWRRGGLFGKIAREKLDKIFLKS